MNERDKLIEKLIKEKGGSREDYLTLLDSIAYHESAGTLDPTIKQIGGGPGRGKYQFETGKNAGGITSARRTKQYYQDNNIPVPEWLNSATSTDDLDASTLTSEQQDILFLGNMRKHPKANFSNIWEGKESIKDFWANYHWAGPKRQRKERIKSFEESLNNYEPSTNNLPEENYIERRQEVQEKTSNEQFNPAPNFLSYLNKKALGGQLNTNNNEKDLNSFNTGGLHEQNPHGGIPQGIGENGKQNTVEEGETSFDLKAGKYIFSNRIKL